jgi:hypothetical protein
MIKNRIEKDGVVVELLGRCGLKYTDGPRTVFVDGEVLVGGSDYVVYEKGMRPWDAAGAPISDDDRARILARIKEAFAANGMILEVE